MSNPDVPILTEGEKLHGIALAQAATHAYLTTLLAATDCMVDTCPDIGMAFKRRWARAPQRIGFEPTAEALETSSREFVSDLKAFSEYASAYFHPAIPLIEKVGGQGALVADSVLEKVAAHSVLLETAGDALMTLADMEAPPEIRDAIESQASGLLRAARVAERELVPLVSQLQELIKHCQRIVEHSRKVYLVDVATGLLNREGFRLEVERRVHAKTLRCLLRLVPMVERRELSDEEFKLLMHALSPSVFEQFRASESIGWWDRQLAVIFGGTVEQAERRRGDIERRLSGEYLIAGSREHVKVTMEVVGPDRAIEVTGLCEVAPQEAIA